MIAVKVQQDPQVHIATKAEVTVSDGGFERGYAVGYEAGEDAGQVKGYADGLAARTYETWTITLTDGTVVEKEVALL